VERIASFAMVDRFEDLEAWKTARQLVNLIYDLSSRSPFSRDFGFVDQARRAAVSVMNNIAEGFESRTQGLFTEYLGRAKGSAGEVRPYSTLLSTATMCRKKSSTSRTIWQTNRRAKSRDSSRISNTLPPTESVG
ncbi:MAG: four helix bundle protein, partial [candidate division NC10 bacterium]